MNFKQSDEPKILKGLKIATLRGLNHPSKGGKREILQSKRVKGGFASGYLSLPCVIDLKDYMTEEAKEGGFDLKLANELGFKDLESYLKESYNTSKDSTLRKYYGIKYIVPNTEYNNSIEIILNGKREIMVTDQYGQVLRDIFFKAYHSPKYRNWKLRQLKFKYPYATVFKDNF